MKLFDEFPDLLLLHEEGGLNWTEFFWGLVAFAGRLEADEWWLSRMIPPRLWRRIGHEASQPAAQYADLTFLGRRFERGAEEERRKWEEQLARGLERLAQLGVRPHPDLPPPEAYQPEMESPPASQGLLTPAWLAREGLNSLARACRELLEQALPRDLTEDQLSEKLGWDPLGGWGELLAAVLHCLRGRGEALRSWGTRGAGWLAGDPGGPGNVQVEELGLPIRLQNILLNQGAEHLRQVCRFSAEEALGFRHMKEEHLPLLRAALARHGLALRGEGESLPPPRVLDPNEEHPVWLARQGRLDLLRAAWSALAVAAPYSRSAVGLAADLEWFEPFRDLAARAASLLLEELAAEGLAARSMRRPEPAWLAALPEEPAHAPFAGRESLSPPAREILAELRIETPAQLAEFSSAAIRSRFPFDRSALEELHAVLRQCGLTPLPASPTAES